VRFDDMILPTARLKVKSYSVNLAKDRKPYILVNPMMTQNIIRHPIKAWTSGLPENKSIQWKCLFDVREKPVLFKLIKLVPVL